MTIRVILADDHAIVRDGLRLLLNAQTDIEVIGEAADGRSAVKMVAQLQPDVLVMDIVMPELNGIEAARIIREKNPEIQIVILSMHSNTEHIYRALQGGVRGYLLKESAGEEVVSAVRAVHVGKRYLSQKITETLVDDYVVQKEISPAKSPIESLSDREREVLQLVVEGKSSAKIAETLHLSTKTVETYRSRLMRKLGVNDLPALVKLAIQHGVIGVD